MHAGQMSSRERIRAALMGEPVDRLPFSPFLAYVWEHMPEETTKDGQLAFHHRIGADPLWRGSPCPVKQIGPEVERRQYTEGNVEVTEVVTPVGSIRHGHRRTDEAGSTLFRVEHPLKTEEDYKVMLWMEENRRFEYDPSGLEEHLQGNGREGFTFGMLCPRGKSAFQMLIEHFAGTLEMNYALMDYPDTVEALWTKMVENDMTAARLAVEAPVEFFLTWEDSGTQNYSPDQYDRYIGSEIRQWCELLESAGKHYIQHACGHLNDLLIPMKESGVFAVESLCTPPTGNIELRDAREKVGSDFGIIGGIEPTLFLNKTEEELPAYVEEVIAEGFGGPFVLANSDSCPPGVTEEKFKLVADTAKRLTQS